MTITRGIHSPVSLAISPSGNLYVANTTAPNGRGLKGDVTVYVPGSANPVRTIKKGIWGPRAFAFDRLGNAYVANLYLSGQSADDSKGSVSEYRQGGTAPIRTFTRGINAPLALAFDSKGSFYVANWGAPAAITYPGGTGNVRTYQPGQSKPNLKIRQGIGNPYTIAIDSQDVLYVASGYNQRWITEYTRGSTSLLRTVPVDASFDMTLDRQGNLYVGQYARILVYSAGSTTPAYAIPSQGMAFALGDR
jgi:hypothetical protein